MKPATLRSLLQGCDSLTNAEIVLGYHQVNRAQAWGFWDGFSGRPHCVAGLGKEPVEPEIAQDYDKAYETGRKAAKR